MERLYTKRFDTGAVCDVSEDFVLPDYIPEVRRVIGVKASVTQDGKYLSGDELETDGAVTYNVVYIGGDGAVCMTSQTSSYTGRVPLKSDRSEDDRYSPTDLTVSYSADNVSCRVTAPRRLTLSCKVRLRVLSQRYADVSMKVQGKGNVRRRSEEHTFAVMTELRKSGECTGELRERKEMRLIMAWGELCLSCSQSSGASGAISVKGDAYVTAVLLSPEGAYVTAKSRAPVEEEFMLPEQIPSRTDIQAAAFGEVVLLEAESSEDGTLSWRMEYDIDCDILSAGGCSVTADAYLTDCGDITEFSTVEAVCPAGAVNGRLTAQTQLKLKPGMTYVCAWGRGSTDKCELANGRIIISGNAYISAIEAGGGEAILDEAAIPFKYECDGGFGKLLPATECRIDGKASVRVTDIQARADGDTLSITAELAVSAILVGSETVKYVSAVAPNASVIFPDKRGGIIRLYVPDEGETSWDVEKKFRLGGEANLEGGVYVI